MLPDKQEVAIALERAVDSAVGPDATPYSAWRATPNVTIAIVLALLSMIFSSNCLIDQSILLAYMVFLPKNSFGLTPSGLRPYSAENLRLPLSLSLIP